MEINGLLTVAVIVALVVSGVWFLIIWWLIENHTKQKKEFESRVTELSNQLNSVQSKREGADVTAQELDGGLREMLEALEKTIDELGLPKARIESTEQLFAAMSPDLRKKLEVFVGPVASTEIAGLVSQRFTMISKVAELQSRLAYYQEQRTADNYKLKVNSLFASRDLDQELSGVDGIVAVATKYGVADVDALEEILQKCVVMAAGKRFLSDLPGVDTQQAVEAMIQNMPLISSSAATSQAEEDVEEWMDEDVNDEIGGRGFHSNGHNPTIIFRSKHRPSEK